MHLWPAATFNHTFTDVYLLALTLAPKKQNLKMNVFPPEDAS